MAGNDRLIFPIEFDLEGAVRKASGDADKVLKQLETAIRARPLKFNVGIETDSYTLKDVKAFQKTIEQQIAKDGSISNLRTKMSALVEEWNKLSEAERVAGRESGSYTGRAKEIIDEYSRLTAATRTYARGLQEIIAASDKAANAEIRANERAQAELDKRIAKSRQLVGMLNAEEASISAVAAKQKFYQDIANKSDFGTARYRYATEQVDRLGAQLQRLKAIMNSNTGNGGKDQYGIEKMRETLRGSESTIEQVQAKLKVLNQLMAGTDQGSYGWRRMTEEASRLSGVLGEMKAQQKEATKTEAQLRAEREAAARAEMENQRKIKAQRAQTNAEIEKERSARQTLIAQKRQEIATLNGEERTIEQVNAKLKIRRELLSRSTEGSVSFQKNAEEIDRLNKRLEELRKQAVIDIKVNIAAMPEKTMGDLTAKIQAWRTSLQGLDPKSADFSKTLGEIGRLQTELEKINKEVAKAEAWRTFQLAIKACIDTMEGLNTRIQAYQSQMQGLKFNSPEWQEAALRIREYNEQLARMSQLAQDYQSKAFSGIGDATLQARIGDIINYRREIERLTTDFNNLNAKGNAFDSKGNLTADATNILKERSQWTKELEKALTTADAAQQRYVEDEKRAAQEAARAAAEQKKLQDAINSTEQTLTALNAKLQAYQTQQGKTDYTSKEWETLALRIREVTEEIGKANQKMADFQQKAFQGLSGNLTKNQVDWVQGLRRQIEDIDRQINNIRANAFKGRGYVDTAEQAQINALLQDRLKYTEGISTLIKTAAQQQLDYEKQITEQKKQQEKITEAWNKVRRQKNMLASTRKDIATITKQLEYYQNLLRHLDPKKNSTLFLQTAEEVKRLTKELEAAKRNIDELTGKSTEGSRRQVSAAKQVREEFRKQETYVSRLIKRLAVYAGFSQINNFLARVREVTAQFELQRVSLGAILQDQVKANQLFSEIKQFALKSPVKILDLTKYTKQLAAYKVGYDELFETTKKLTDVSVGLGVSMDRVVLAYGQVRATGHLRASEIRQFTEMGVPIVEELAAKLSKMNGEIVTAADVMDMVSKRAISFQMVKEVFDDMTSAGGIFYNMQEKQGNTLYGMWAKLGDAASVMYEQIGNTGWVNDSMKTLIQGCSDLMKNWKSLAETMIFPVAPMVAVLLLIRKGGQVKAAAEAKAIAATQARIKAEEYLNTVTQNGTAQQIRQARATLAKAMADEKAARAANIHALGQSKLRAGATSVWRTFERGLDIGVAITLVTTLVYEIWKAINASSRLKDKLDEIWSETSVLREQSVRNFEQLVSAATDPSKTVKEQKLALDELNRTYKDMLPQEALKIENLKALEGNYTTLTDAVREYIAVQQQEKAINTINEEEGSIQTKAQRQLREAMGDKGRLGYLALSDAEIERFFRQFEKTSLDTTKTIKEQFVEAFRLAGLQGAEEVWKVVKKTQQNWFEVGPGIFGTEDEQVRATAAIGALSESLARQQSQNEAIRESFAKQTESVGAYTSALQSYDQWLTKNLLPDDNTFLTVQQNKNMTAGKMVSVIKAAMTGAKIAWDESWVEMVDSVDAENLFHLTSLKFEEIIKAIDPNKYPDLRLFVENFRNRYEAMIPSDSMVQQIQFKLMSIADATGVGMDKMQRFLWDGSTKIDEHIKVLGDQIDSYKAKLKAMQTTLANQGLLGSILNFALKGQIEDTTKLIEALEKQMEFEKTYVINNDKDKNKGRKSDTRLQLLQEINQTLEKINKEYDDLVKKEGNTNALADIKKQFEDTLEYTNKIGKKFGLHFDYPTEFKSLQEYRREILKVMRSLKDLKGGEKAILQFQTMIDKADSDELQRQIEKQLKELADRISRTKTAKEFYEKILEQTGDVELAKSVSLSIYGDDGAKLFEQTVEQIKEVFKSGNAEVVIDVDAAIDTENQRINYKTLADIYDKYQNDIIEKNRDTAQKIIAEGQKTAASNVSTWEKELAKAKDFEQQRTDIINRETQRRAEIIRSNEYTPEQKEERLKWSQEKQDKEIADLNWKEFKEGDDYIKIFENLDNVSTAALKRLRENLEQVKTANADLSPENMKALVKAMEDIDEQISGRGFGNDMVQGVKDYIQAIRDLKTAKSELQAAEAEYDAQEPMLDAEIDAAREEEIAAQTALNLLKQSELATDSQIVAAELRLNTAISNVAIAENKKAQAAEKVKKAEQKVTDQTDKQKKATGKFFKDLEKVAQTADQLASILGDVQEMLGVSADSAAGVAFDSAIQGLNEFSKIMNTIIALQTLYNIVTSSNPWLAIASAVLAVGQMLGSFIANNKVRKANKEIERQQELLDQLEYTYSRLEKSAERAFGGDYISNYNQRVRNLQAQAEAYQKQANAERSKGKKADKDKIKEYEDSYRDTMDEIADMQGEIAAQMLGADLTSAARDFAKAWIEAYKEFGNTADAMSEKFHEMIENMVVEGALAKVVENALQPVFDMIESSTESDWNDPVFYKRVADAAEKAGKNADVGSQVMMRALEQAGFSIRDLGGDLTGISRDIATASEESINGLAQGINTQNFYISQIHANVALIAERMGATDITGQFGVDYTPLIQQSLENQAMMIRYQAETVAECRSISAKCQEQVDYLRKVVVPKSTVPTYVVATKIV